MINNLNDFYRDLEKEDQRNFRMNKIAIKIIQFYIDLNLSQLTDLIDFKI